MNTAANTTAARLFSIALALFMTAGMLGSVNSLATKGSSDASLLAQTGTLLASSPAAARKS